MLLIILSYIYILIVIGIWGIAVNNCFKIHKSHVVLTCIHGLYGVMVFALLWAIMWPLNGWFHIVLIVVSFYFGVKYKQGFNDLLKNLAHLFSGLNKPFKYIFFVITLLTLLKCAGLPTLPDNESYYIQTIKWFTEYGMVTGLINLHPFLGQASGWHALQSVFGFGFVINNLNDLNGLVLILGNLFALEKLNLYFKWKNKVFYNLAIGLWPIANLIFFLLISSPSTDLPIYVFGMILFYLCLSNEKNPDANHLKSIWILTVALFLIKATTFWFILLPIILTYKHKVLIKEMVKYVTILLTLTGGILLIKNIIITGNPIYPMVSTKALKMSWALPEVMETYLFQYAKAYGFGQSPDVYNTATFWQLLKYWLFNNGFDGLLNFVAISILLLSPLAILKYKSNSVLKFIFILAILQLISLLFTSPQIRFYLVFIFFFGFLLLSIFISQKKLVTICILASLCLSVIVALPIGSKFLWPHSINQNLENITWKNIVIPHENTNQHKTDYIKIIEGNTTFHSPKNSAFFWNTNNAPVPALNQEQLNYFKTYFKYIPQKRTQHLEDGFISKKVK